MLCNHARLDWTKFGGRNTKYFHAIIKERRKYQAMQLARADESIISETKEIGEVAQVYFSALFTASPFHLGEVLLRISGLSVWEIFRARLFSKSWLSVWRVCSQC